MKNIFLLLITILLVNCSQQKARKPISHSEGTFMKESAERNKKIVAKEEKTIDSIIKSNPSIKYFSSKKGYWYTYESKNETDTLRPKRGDIAYFEYDVKDVQGNIIYTKEEIKLQIYTVDKQNIMTGLQDGIKLMRKNETVKFLFTSNNAYGYHGDNDKIATNESLICTVTLKDIKLANTSKITNKSSKTLVEKSKTDIINIEKEVKPE